MCIRSIRVHACMRACMHDARTAMLVRACSHFWRTGLSPSALPLISPLPPLGATLHCTARHRITPGPSARTHDPLRARALERFTSCARACVRHACMRVCLVIGCMRMFACVCVCLRVRACRRGLNVLAPEKIFDPPFLAAVQHFRETGSRQKIKDLLFNAYERYKDNGPPCLPACLSACFRAWLGFCLWLASLVLLPLFVHVVVDVLEPLAAAVRNERERLSLLQPLSLLLFRS